MATRKRKTTGEKGKDGGKQKVAHKEGEERH
jgi:hypothetical protein